MGADDPFDDVLEVAHNGVRGNILRLDDDARLDDRFERRIELENRRSCEFSLVAHRLAPSL